MTDTNLAEMLRGGTIAVSGGDITIAYATADEAGDAFDALLDFASPSRLSANDEGVTDQECDHICMGECATEGCENCGLHYYESGGVGSYYCGACLRKIKALSTKPEAHPETDWGPDVGAEVLPSYAQPPTPASGEQMEVVDAVSGFEPGEMIDEIDVENIERLVVTLEAAQKTLDAANERAERVERERDELDFLLSEGGTMEAQLRSAEERAERAERERDERLKFHVRSFSALNSRYLAAEALNTTLSEALTRIAEGNLGPEPWQANYDRIKQVASEALAALPAKQGGQS